MYGRRRAALSVVYSMSKLRCLTSTYIANQQSRSSLCSSELKIPRHLWDLMSFAIFDLATN
jgi:hypothetical protein